MSKAPAGHPVAQIDWYGALWDNAMHHFECEIPAYLGHWFGSMSRCRPWDSRDWYELLDT